MSDRATIRFTVPAVPVAQPRPRAVSFGGKARMANSPSKHPVHGFRATVALAAQQVHRGPPLDCPLAMRMVFVMPRPTSKVWKTKPMPREPYAVKKNDWDNLGKAVCDALNGVLYADDGLLAKVQVERVIAAGDEQPHVEIELQSLLAE